MRPTLRALGLSVFFLACWPAPPGVRAAEAPRAAAPRVAKPRLVLVLMVDQFRYDFLERFADLFGPGGFRLLTDRGAVFVNARFNHVPTYTASGHAAVFTGSVPAEDGIVGNGWFDRGSGEVRAAVADGGVHLLTSAGRAEAAGAPSPRSLLGTTIGDQMRLASNFASRVVAVSFKDRSAILPGGKRPNGAYWFDASRGSFVSSDYYFDELPGWVKRFDAAERPDRYYGTKWELALPEEAYRRSQARKPHLERWQLGEDFPYVVTGGEDKPGESFYEAFQYTPFASDHLASFAEAALDGESLGADAFPDLLSVSFSSPDFVGHAYGPDSREVEDTFVRLDRTIARLLEAVDRRVGLAATLVVLTGDHGVSPVPEYLASVGIDAGRIEAADVEAAVERGLVARFGGEKWVLSFFNDQVYLDLGQAAARKLEPRDLERAAGEAALTVPGIARYFTRSQILEGRMPPGSLSRRVVNSFHRERSGDVCLVTKPFYFVSEGPGTAHGSPYSYDTHVPLILFGAGIRPGRYTAECSPSDVAPTVAALLGVEPPPHTVGRILGEALAASTHR